MSRADWTGLLEWLTADVGRTTHSERPHSFIKRPTTITDYPLVAMPPGSAADPRRDSAAGGSCWLTRSWEPRDQRWTLAWDGQHLTLTAPDGTTAFVGEPAPRVLDLNSLDDRAIRFVVGFELLEFRRRKTALVALRAAVDAALVEDAAFRAERKQLARDNVRGGFILGIVAGGLLALSCWWAATSVDPAPGTWLRWFLDWFGWLLGWLLLVLTAMAGAGPMICYSGLRELRRVRAAERRTDRPPAESHP